MGSIPVGSTKKQTRLCLLLLSRLGIERLLTQPDSRTLGVLAAIREYQKADTDVSAFAIPYFINALYKNTDSKESSADNE